MDHELVASTDTLARYRQGRLNDEEREAFEIHMLSCNTCQQDLETDDMLSAGLSQTRGRSSGRGWRRSRLYRPTTYAAAASVVVAVGAGLAVWLYSNRQSGTEHLRDPGERAQALFLVRARGVEDSAPVPLELRSGTQLAVFVLDAAQPELGEYKIAITNAGGETVWAGTPVRRAEGVGSGARQLVVLVPTSALPAGEYEIAVTGRNADGREVRSVTFRAALSAASSQ